jgi:ketosteroid isomerase-like protein
MTATASFDLATFARALEERDAELLTGFYADDAELILVDRDHPPATPRVLRGRQAIDRYHRDICGRDMTHRVTRELVSGPRAAVAEERRYPDGTRVLGLAVLELADGRIASQLAVQAWDEP